MNAKLQGQKNEGANKQGPLTDVLSKFQNIRIKHTRQNVYLNAKPPPPPESDEESLDGSLKSTGRVASDFDFLKSRGIPNEWFGSRRYSTPSVLRTPIVKGNNVIGMTGSKFFFHFIHTQF